MPERMPESLFLNNFHFIPQCRTCLTGTEEAEEGEAGINYFIGYLQRQREGYHLFKICVVTNIWHLSNLWVHIFQCCSSLASGLTNKIAGLAVSGHRVSADAELTVLIKDAGWMHAVDFVFDVLIFKMEKTNPDF